MNIDQKINYIRRQRLVAMSIFGMLICSLLMALFMIYGQSETIVVEEVRVDDYKKIKALLYKKLSETYL